MKPERYQIGLSLLVIGCILFEYIDKNPNSSELIRWLCPASLLLGFSLTFIRFENGPKI